MHLIPFHKKSRPQMHKQSIATKSGDFKMKPNPHLCDLGTKNQTNSRNSSVTIQDDLEGLTCEGSQCLQTMGLRMTSSWSERQKTLIVK